MKNQYIHIRTLIVVGVCLLSCGLGSCKKFLELKPDKLQVTPASLKDCQALLDDYLTMNSRYPGEGENAADNYYYTDDSYFNALSPNAQDNYLWKPLGEHDLTLWQYPYLAAYQANVVLQTLDKIGPSITGDYASIKGQALFFRSFAFYSVAQLFAKPYDEATAANDPGIPLRLNPDLNYVSVRGTVKQTYERIIQDLKEAVTLLPVSNLVKTRPTRVAAFAMLARTYLAMGKYTEAGIYADSCLNRYNVLLNYASIITPSPISTAPTMTRLNAEVIFPALGLSSAPLSQSDVKVDLALYNSYQANDKRKVLFFMTNTGANVGTFGFKGSYDGAISTIFCGLATDEIYLIRAECYARAGNTISAMADLNALMSKRWDPALTVPAAPYVNMSASSATDALDKILIERRKELVFRTLRWTDLRRLNMESRYATVLSRSMNTLTYTPMQPKDLRYTMLIPINVITIAGIAQNPR